MKIRLTLFLLLLTAITFGCKSNKQGNASNGSGKEGKEPVQYEFTEIVFGSYGGFTGQRLEYTVNRTGAVTLYDSMKEIGLQTVWVFRPTLARAGFVEYGTEPGYGNGR